MKKTILLLGFLFFCFFSIFAQQISEKGVPILKNFAPADYQNQGKIWDIGSAPNGIIAMAADKGLLTFDGKLWENHKGSKGFTRSLLIVNDSLIYTGSDLDFGHWHKNKYGIFEYESLYPFKEETNTTKEEFWDIYELQGVIYFVSFTNIYIYKNKQIIAIPAPSKFTSSFKLNNLLYFADEKEGLLILNDLKLKQFFKFPADKQPFEISGLFTIKNQFWIVTKQHGLFLFTNNTLTQITNELSKKLATAKVFAFNQLDKNHLAFGTVLKGLFITDINGNIIHHINKNKGLANNTILSLHLAAPGDFWLGLDHGIARLNLLSDLTYVSDLRGDFGSGYAAILKDNYFYLGTNQGLYRTKWNDLDNRKEYNNFEILPKTEGQVWNLKNIDNELFICHDKGLFTLKGNTISTISLEHGFWTILPYKNYLVTGNYNGISIFEKKNEKWQFLKKMDFILGSCNQLIVDKNQVLWINIPNYGIIRTETDNNLKPIARTLFPEKDFEGEYPHIEFANDSLYVITNTNKYAYIESKKEFLHHQKITEPFPFDNWMPTNHQFTALDSNYAFLPAYNGFILKYLNQRKVDKDLLNKKPILKKIEALNNDITNTYYQNATIPYFLNNLRITCIVPNQANVNYQFKLKSSDNWSKPIAKNTFDFLNLKHGKYTILLRSISNQKYSEPIAVNITIAAPWYRTNLAYIFAFLLFVLMIYLLKLRQKQLLVKQKIAFQQKEELALLELAEKHRLEVLDLEQEILKKENDQLKEKLKNKTIELANKAKESEEKNRLLLTVKEKFEMAQKDSTQTKIKLSEIKRLLDTYLNVDDKTFEIQMDELHQEFFKKLKEKFPTLSNHDFRLCAYLKIGLNSREIAEILNIQPSSAFISRSRLRKKLNLRPEEDLNEFLNNI